MTTPATRQIWPDAVEEALDSPGGAKWHRVALQVNPYFRQLVFSTHNANIPVLGDAELLVVLESAGRKGHIAECPFTGPVELGRCAGFDLGGPRRRVGLILGP